MGDCSLTPELEVAYEDLQSAIQRITHLWEAHIGERAGIVTDYIVVVASQDFDDEGNGRTGYNYYAPIGGGGVPPHRLEGLLHRALRMLDEAGREE